jgi:predicted PurR-regulated permease PerM
MTAHTTPAPHESRPFFTLVLVVALCLVVFVLWPYVGEVAIGILAAILFRPVYERALTWQWTRGRPVVALLVTLLALALTVIVPLLIAGGVITSQARRLLSDLRSLDVRGVDAQLGAVLAWVERASGQSDGELRTNLREGAKQIVERMAGGALGLFGTVPEMIISFWVFLATMIYVLPIYPRLVGTVKRGLPLAPSTSQRFLDQAVIGIRSTVLSIVVVASVQGLTTGVVLWLLGVPYTAIWTLLCVIAAIFPLGLLVITVPLAAGLGLTGWTWQPIVLLIWTFVVVPNIDDLLRPVLISRTTKLHWALVMISSFGGAALFGVWGVVAGPVALIVARTAISIYFEEYVEPDEVAERPGPRPGEAAQPAHGEVVSAKAPR